MDKDVATWLAGMIKDASSIYHGNNKGLLIEVVDNPHQWVQVIPERDVDGQVVTAYILNLPYLGQARSPLEVLGEIVQLPPGTQLMSWEADGFATLRLRPDIPLIPFSMLIGELFEELLTASTDYDLAVEYQTGFDLQ